MISPEGEGKVGNPLSRLIPSPCGEGKGEGYA